MSKLLQKNHIYEQCDDAVAKIHIKIWLNTLHGIRTPLQDVLWRNILLQIPHKK